VENVHLFVIPAKAGIHWLQVLRDPCLRRDDGEEALFDTLDKSKETSVFQETTHFIERINEPDPVKEMRHGC
jgi:hypothetical protein